MIDIQSQDKIKRGEVLRGKVIIELDKDVKVRAVSVSLDNRLSYPNPCTKNFSGWSTLNHLLSPDTGDRLRSTIIPFEFNIPREAPPTYSGKSLVSNWKINVKIDRPLSFDIHAEKIVEVER